MQLTIRLILVFLFVSTSYLFAATEDLDEVVDRKSRISASSWGYSVLEGAVGTGYVWQPETFCFTNTYGKEVWRLTGGADIPDYIYDITYPSISADGKRMAFLTDRESASIATIYTDAYDLWMVVNLDGSYLRPLTDSEQPIAAHDSIKSWNPVEPDVYYNTGAILSFPTTSKDQVYKVTVSDTSTSFSSILDFNNDVELIFQKSMSPDGLKAIVMSYDESTLYPITLGSSPAIDVVGGYPSNRPTMDSYWGGCTWGTNFSGFHDQFMTGAVDGQYGIKFNWLTGSNATDCDSEWFASDLTGTDADGGPELLVDYAYPYVWGNIHVINTKSGDNGVDPWNKAYGEAEDVDDAGYPSHPAFGNWGKYMFFVGNNGVSPYDGGSHILNRATNKVTNSYTNSHGHTDWHSWSDYLTGDKLVVDKTDDRILSFKYDNSTVTDIANPWRKINGGANTESYNATPRPTQSPDGTKTFYHSVLSNNDDGTNEDYPNIYYVVVYYPYPPEIISASSGVVRFDYRTDQATSRGYTQRGWPNESTDDPPPPRETKEFRLWKSSDGSTGWEPVAKVTANMFTKYDYSDGTWAGTKYWEITDPSPSGYYAVTAIEHSGLESRTLSNVFRNSTELETTAYPASPGADDNIISSYDSTLHRYYNVYAEDSSTPSISQTNRIASDSRTTKSYIDVMGNSDDSTLYTVTAVDTQGNESSALSVTVETDTPSAGLYTITWDEATEATHTGITSTGVDFK